MTQIPGFCQKGKIVKSQSWEDGQKTENGGGGTVARPKA